MRAIFISDLHLHEHDAVTDARFRAFARTAARGADDVYILGDLLHAWLGDALLRDDAYAQSIVAELKALAASGSRVHLARGNRDFMIGERFAEAAGARLLDEQTLITLGGQRVLLMHGDELCTDDVRYQRARRVLRARAFRAFGDALPAFVRRSIARRLRAASESHKAVTAMQIMDANPAAIASAMRAHDVPLLIHGHTHRPAHEHLADGRERRVLSDWQQDYGYLEWQDGRWKVQPWPDAAPPVSI